MNIFTLMGTIMVDNAKANESISSTDEKAGGLANKLGEGIKTAGKWGLGLAAAAGAGATAMYGMAMKTAETTDRIDKMSAKIGMSKQSFQEWDYVLGQNGMDVEKLQVGVKTLTAQMDAVAQGNESATANFERLGLSINDTSGAMKSQEQMTNEAIMALANMENGTEKARLATEMFGKAGIEMMPMLNGGAEGITQLKDRAHELGLVMSDETVTAGVVLGDTMDDVKASFGAIVTKIGAEVMPIVQSLLEWVLKYMPEIQAVVSVVFQAIEGVVSGAILVIQWLIDAFGKLFEGSTENSNGIKSVLENLGEAFTNIFNAISGVVAAFIDACKKFWDKYSEDIISVFQGAFDIVSSIFDTAVGTLTEILGIFKAIFSGDWESMWEGIMNLFSTIWEGMQELFPLLLDGLLNVMKLSFSLFLDIGKGMFNMIWDGMKSIWTSISSWVSEKVTWLTDKLMFWKKSKSEMNSSEESDGIDVDGSHANGLSYVPYDSYIAELHEGERVLTKKENEDYSKKTKGGDVYVTINSPKALNPSETSREFKKVSRELAFDI